MACTEVLTTTTTDNVDYLYLAEVTTLILNATIPTEQTYTRGPLSRPIRRRWVRGRRITIITHTSIHTLPIELLSLIFHHHVHSNSAYPQSLLRICRKWSTILKESPSVWTWIRLPRHLLQKTFYDLGPILSNIVHTHATHSGKLALTLDLRMWTSKPLPYSRHLLRFLYGTPKFLEIVFGLVDVRDRCEKIYTGRIMPLDMMAKYEMKGVKYLGLDDILNNEFDGRVMHVKSWLPGLEVLALSTFVDVTQVVDASREEGDKDTTHNDPEEGEKTGALRVHLDIGESTMISVHDTLLKAEHANLERLTFGLLVPNPRLQPRGFRFAHSKLKELVIYRPVDGIGGTVRIPVDVCEFPSLEVFQIDSQIILPERMITPQLRELYILSTALSSSCSAVHKGHHLSNIEIDNSNELGSSWWRDFIGGTPLLEVLSVSNNGYGDLGGGNFGISLVSWLEMDDRLCPRLRQIDIGGFGGSVVEEAYGRFRQRCMRLSSVPL